MSPLKLVFSPINQCWFLMFYSQPVEFYPSMADAKTDLRSKGLIIDKHKNVISAD